MTLYLALDTSTEELAVGLGTFTRDGVHVIGEVNVDVPRASLTHLVPTIQRLVLSADLEMRDVGAVVVGRGPGSFTGVRIGVATAKGISQGLDVPLFGVGTLDAIAERFAGHDGLVGVIGDAMRKEVYPALFRCESGALRRLTPHAVAAPADVAAQWRALGEPVLLAGNGLAKYAEVFSSALGDAGSLAPEAMWSPTGSALLAAAWRADAAGEMGDGHVSSVLPVYTRLSDAEVNELSRSGAPGPTPSSGVAGPVEGAGR